MTCPCCERPIRPGQPVALVRVGSRGDERIRVLHLTPCGEMILLLAILSSDAAWARMN